MDDIFAEDDFDPSLFEQIDRIVDQHKSNRTAVSLDEANSQVLLPVRQPLASASNAAPGQQQVHPLYGPLNPQTSGLKRPVLQVQSRSTHKPGYVSPGVFGASPSPPIARPPATDFTHARGTAITHTAPETEMVRRQGSSLRERFGKSQATSNYPANANTNAAAATAQPPAVLPKDGPAQRSSLLQAQLDGFVDMGTLSRPATAAPSAVDHRPQRTPPSRSNARSPLGPTQPESRRQLDSLERTLAFKEQELLDEKRRSTQSVELARVAESHAKQLQAELQKSEALRQQLQQELEEANRERRARAEERQRSNAEAGPSQRLSQPLPSPRTKRSPTQPRSTPAAAVAPVRTRSVGTSPGDSAQPGISPWQLPWVAPGPEASDRSAVLELLDLAARHFMQPTAATTAYNVPVTDGIWSQVQQLAKGEDCGPAILLSIARLLSGAQASMRPEKGGHDQLLPALLLLPPLFSACPGTAQLAVESCQLEIQASRPHDASTLLELRQLSRGAESRSGVLGLLLGLQQELDAGQLRDQLPELQGALLGALHTVTAAGRGSWLAPLVVSGQLDGVVGDDSPQHRAPLLALLRHLVQDADISKALVHSSGSDQGPMEIDDSQERSQPNALLEVPLLCIGSAASRGRCGCDESAMRLPLAALEVVADLLLRQRVAELEVLATAGFSNHHAVSDRQHAAIGSRLLALIADVWAAVCAGPGIVSAAEGSSPTGAWQLKALQELLLVLRCILRVGHAAAAVLDDLTATGALQRQSLTLMARIGDWMTTHGAEHGARLALWVGPLGQKYIGRECYVPGDAPAVASRAEAMQLAASIRRRLVKRLQS